MVLFENIEDIFQQIRDSGQYSRAIITLVTSFGAITLVYFFIRIILCAIQGIRLYICNQICCKSDFTKRYGRWAVITGATDGIGKSMAIELAKRGHSIVVIGRNEQKLAETKSRLEEESNVGEVVTIKIDLSDSSLQNFEKVKSQLDIDNRDIGILINNAGLYPARYTLFTNHSMEHLRDIVNVNVMAPVYMTRMILPSMLKRGKGLVLNVSSGLGSVPSPYISVYGPTKSFLDRFSFNLQSEYSSYPIDIINLKPGPVHTKLLTGISKMSKPTVFSPSADDFARAAVNALGSRVGNYSGVMMHGLMNESFVVLNFLGIIPLMIKFQAKFMSNNSNFSIEPETEENTE